MRTGHGPEVTHMCKEQYITHSMLYTGVKRKKTRKVVDMEATDVSVYSFIHKFLCGGNRRMCEQMIMRKRIKRKKAECLIMAFCGLKATISVQCGCGLAASSGGIVAQMASVKWIK